jgi:hypothetical protein
MALTFAGLATLAAVGGAFSIEFLDQGVQAYSFTFG